MQIIFTSLSVTNTVKFSNVKLNSFIFEEPKLGSLKIMATNEASGVAGNGTVSDAIGTIAGAINEAALEDRRRLLLELEILMRYFKNNTQISEFLDKVLVKLGDVDDWD